MPEWLVSLFSGAGSSLLNSALGQIFGLTRAEREQNSFNSSEAAKSRQFQQQLQNSNNIFNATEAQKNRDFQADQAATQYQRGVADMRAAGINPALAYGQGGAQAMSGSAASASAAPAPASASGSGRGHYSSLSEILAASMLKKELKMKEAQIGEIESRKFVNEMNAKLAEAQTGLASSQSALTNKQVLAFDVKNDKEMRLLDEQLKTAPVQRALAQANISETEARASLNANNALLAATDLETRSQLNRLEAQLRIAKTAETYSSSAELRARVGKYQAEITELYQRALLHAAESGNLDAQTENYYVQNDILKYDREHKKFIVDHQNADRNWEKVSMVFGMVRDLGQGVGSVLGGVSGMSAVGNMARGASSMARPTLLQAPTYVGSGEYSGLNTMVGMTRY